MIAVSLEAIRFPNEGNIKSVQIGIRNHPLEFRAIAISGRHRSIYIRVDDIDAVASSEVFALTDLALDGFLPLFWQEYLA